MKTKTNMPKLIIYTKSSKSYKNKNEETSPINNSTLHIKKFKKEEQNRDKVRIKKEKANKISHMIF